MNGRSANGSVSVAGGWLGTYQYGGFQAMLRPVRFEASLHAPLPGASQFYGEIIDDGPRGSARVTGSQESHIVRFDKSYISSSEIGQTKDYEYRGIISDDGKVMRGTWRVSVKIGFLRLPRIQGTWHARRMWAEDEEISQRQESETLQNPSVISNPHSSVMALIDHASTHTFLLYLLLMVASFAAGAINSVAGGGTLLTFPTLLLLTSSISANATNTIALVPASLSAMWGYRSDIKDAKSDTIALAIPSLIGGAIGAFLLLRTGDTTFKALIPWLIFGATLLFLVQQPVANALERRRLASEKPIASRASRRIGAGIMQLVVSIYGGFFGAGIGIMMLAALGFMGMADDIHRTNGIKNFAAACINGIASVVFIIKGKVDWPLAAIMAITSIFGGYFGAGIARKAGQTAVRRFIVFVGCQYRYSDVGYTQLE